MGKNGMFVFRTVVFTAVAILAGGMFGFIFPFDDPVIAMTAFCTVIICTVMAVCTCVILNAVEGKNSTGEDQKEE